MVFLYTVVYFSIFFLLVSLVWLVALPFDPLRRLTHRMLTLWSVYYIALCPVWRMRIYGRERLEKGQRYVLVSNHQSMLDIIVLYCLRWPFKWVAKRELFSTPLFGTLLRMGDYVSIERASRSDAQRMIARCEEFLAKGRSILLFPEGTRGKSGRVGRFKAGAFTIAQESHTAVVPIVVSGPVDSFKGRLFTPRCVTLSIHILDPIPADRVASFAQRELTLHVEGLIREKHRELNPHLY